MAKKTQQELDTVANDDTVNIDVEAPEEAEVLQERKERWIFIPHSAPGAEQQMTTVGGGSTTEYHFNITLNNTSYKMPCDDLIDISEHPAGDAIWQGFPSFRRS
jgi:hypothetical protein